MARPFDRSNETNSTLANLQERGQKSTSPFLFHNTTIPLLTCPFLSIGLNPHPPSYPLSSSSHPVSIPSFQLQLQEIKLLQEKNLQVCHQSLIFKNLYFYTVIRLIRVLLFICKGFELPSSSNILRHLFVGSRQEITHPTL